MWGGGFELPTFGLLVNRGDAQNAFQSNQFSKIFYERGRIPLSCSPLVRHNVITDAVRAPVITCSSPKLRTLVL